MEEAAENGKERSHSARADQMNECMFPPIRKHTAYTQDFQLSQQTVIKSFLGYQSHQ
jgi:hypothetical protein